MEKWQKNVGYKTYRKVFLTIFAVDLKYRMRFDSKVQANMLIFTHLALSM